MRIPNRIITMLFIALSLFFACLSMSCLSTNDKSEYENRQNYIYMHDNCPNETNARLAQSAIKSSVKGYKGITLYDASDTPAPENISNVSDYYDYCKSIKTAIAKGSRRLCNLTFNTEKDGSGINLDLSTEEARIDSIIKMIAYGKTEIYAIYSY